MLLLELKPTLGYVTLWVSPTVFVDIDLVSFVV